MAETQRIHKFWPTSAVGVGLLAAFIGERVLAGRDTGRIMFDALAAIALIAATGVRFTELSGAPPDKRPVARILFLTTLGVLVALLLYATIPLLLTSEGAKTPRAIVWALWPIVLACSVTPLAAVEIATFSSAYIDRYELPRVRHAFDRGLALALLVSIVFLINFLGERHEIKSDLSYGQKASASEQARRVVRDLTSDVKVTLFFPRANEVAEAVDSYFSSLKALSPHLSVQQVDLALASQLAKDTGVSENGYVAISRDKAHERVRIGDKMASARSQLKKLDSSFINAVLKVTKEKKVAYFTTGHEERTASPGPNDARPPIRLLKQLLETNQYTVKNLGIAEGLSDKVPEDASIIFIMGPERAFSKLETDALSKATEHGVRLFIALEAERDGQDLAPILGSLGLKFDKTFLVNEATHVSITHTDADRTAIWSNRYSSHESVTTMTRNQRLATIFQKTGSIAKTSTKTAANLRVDIVLTALDETFADLNGNLKYDPPKEKKTAYGLAAAVTRTSTSGKRSDETRIFVVADTDVLADELIKYEGNLNLLADIVYWLHAVEEPMVAAISEADVQIVHKKEEDTLWFYSTTLGVPALVLLFGLVGVKRRRR